MKNYCIICAGAVRNMVMVSVYTDYLESAGIAYDLIYMDKYHQEEETGAKTNYRYEYNSITKMGKIEGYIGFVIYAESIIKKNKYNFVIVWGELTAALLCAALSFGYNRKYCVNIRDLFVGKRKVFNILLNLSIWRAAFVTVSSPKYIEKLPKILNNYIFFHSFNDKIMRETKNVTKHLDSTGTGRIRILYIGNIRFYDHLYRFINCIADDSRYELTIVGVGSEPVQEYVNKKQIDNIHVQKTFSKERTADFLKYADVIYNLYGTEDLNLKAALSNKLYYAIYLNIPILVYKDTFMYEVASSCGIGYAVDYSMSTPFVDDFYKWYTSRDRQEINQKCNRMIKEARKTQDDLISTLKHASQ